HRVLYSIKFRSFSITYGNESSTPLRKLAAKGVKSSGNGRARQLGGPSWWRSARVGRAGRPAGGSLRIFVPGLGKPRRPAPEAEPLPSDPLGSVSQHTISTTVNLQRPPPRKGTYPDGLQRRHRTATQSRP